MAAVLPASRTVPGIDRDGTMDFELLEAFTCGKDGRGDGREDGIVVGRHFAAVVDGVGSYPDLTVDGHTRPGRLARDVALAVVSDLEPAADLRTTVDRIASRLADRLDQAGIDHRNLPRPPACQLTVYSHKRRQVWRVGDTSVRIGDRVHVRDQQFDLLCNSMRTMLRHAALLAGTPADSVLADDPMAPLLNDLIVAQSHLLNVDVDSPYTFGWVAPSRTPDRFLETFDVPDGADVVMCTDGYPHPAATLADAEEALAQELDRRPYDDWRAIDRDLVAPSAVSYDDRAYVRLRP